MTLTRLANETDAQYIARLQGALAAKPATTGRTSFKVSEKGALSVYGFQRFPITYYKETWRKLAETMPQILKFAEDNEHLLKSKGDDSPSPAASIAPTGQVLPPAIN